MEQNNLMEGLNETQAVGGLNSRGGIVAKLAVGALGVAVGIGTIIFLKKRKAKKAECEYVESEDVIEDDE